MKTLNDLPIDQRTTVIYQRYKDKPHKDYTKQLDDWNKLNKQLSWIVSVISGCVVTEILDVSVDRFNILTIRYRSGREPEIAREICCDSSYLDLPFDDVSVEWKCCEADYQAMEAAKEAEQARGARYRMYKKLRAEFDPDYVPEDD